jgi:hypothetical protein
MSVARLARRQLLKEGYGPRWIGFGVLTDSPGELRPERLVSGRQPRKNFRYELILSISKERVNLIWDIQHARCESNQNRCNKEGFGGLRARLNYEDIASTAFAGGVFLQ